MQFVAVEGIGSSLGFEARLGGLSAPEVPYGDQGGPDHRCGQAIVDHSHRGVGHFPFLVVGCRVRGQQDAPGTRAGFAEMGCLELGFGEVESDPRQGERHGCGIGACSESRSQNSDVSDGGRPEPATP